MSTSRPGMSQFAIKANKDALRRRIINLRLEITHAEGQLDDLQIRCPHTNRQIAGDNITRYECDDCGKSWTTRT